MLQPLSFLIRTTQKRNVAALVLALELLPAEIWDEVFRHLTLDEDLLRTAKVCMIFNILCISLLLERFRVPSLDSPELRVSSSVLPALQLSRTPLGASRLICHFDDVGAQRGVVALRHIIERSDTLRRVDLTFSGDLTDAHERDISVTEALRSSWRMHHEFWGALSAMALKAPAGRVEIMSERGFFGGLAADVAGWSRVPRVGPVSQKKTAFFRRHRMTQTLPAPWPVGVPYGYTGRLELYRIYSVSVHSLSDPNPDPTKAYNTLLIFNADLVEMLHLTMSPLPATLISEFLPILDLPALKHAFVPGGIERRAMTDFLLRHPRLQVFEHTDFYTWSLRLDPDDGGAPTITTHSIAHPGLREINARGITNIQRAVTALGSSPSLATLTFMIYPTKSERLGDLCKALRIIAQRPNNSVPLYLGRRILNSGGSGASRYTRRSIPSSCFSLDDEISTITRSLHCIHKVKITSSSRDTANATLPWLALFPALRKVTLEVDDDEYMKRLGPRPYFTELQEAHDAFRRPAERVLEGVEVEVQLRY